MAYQRNRIDLYDARNRKYHGRNLVMLGFAAILLASLGISANEVLAMGQAPSTCNNRYDGTITYMKITVGHRTYYPIDDPGLSFELKNNRSYTVEFTIHTANQSSQNSTSGGTTWYDTDSPGYQIGTCVSGAAPDQGHYRGLHSKPSSQSGTRGNPKRHMEYPDARRDNIWCKMGKSIVSVAKISFSQFFSNMVILPSFA